MEIASPLQSSCNGDVLPWPAGKWADQVSKDYRVVDQGLWDEVRRAVKPLGRPNGSTNEPTEGRAVSPNGMKASLSSHLQLPGARIAGIAPPLQAFDRRTAQRLGRGLIEPDARLDLHGDSLESARMKLLHFVVLERQRGAKVVLVITGKGASPYALHTLHGQFHFHAPERQGRLRRELPRWLAEEQFRHHVVGFQPSHPKHGGGGAFYVRLRKNVGNRP